MSKIILIAKVKLFNLSKYTSKNIRIFEITGLKLRDIDTNITYLSTKENKYDNTDCADKGWNTRKIIMAKKYFNLKFEI